ncbi:MAG TPA: glycosyltransferase [Pirellulales bacterium]|jgi:dolichyl-phosphate beta-glucosyltransferase
MADRSKAGLLIMITRHVGLQIEDAAQSSTDIPCILPFRAKANSMPALPKSDHELTVIIPAFNEERRLPKTLASLARFMDASRLNYRVVVADDGSTDQTPALTRGLGWRFSTVSLPENRGKGCAVRNAMLAATGEVVAFTDADLPFDLKSLIEGYRWIAQQRCEVAFGTRHAEQSESRISRRWIRTLATHTFQFLVRNFVSRDVSDCQCGLKVFSRRAAVEIFSRAEVDGFAFDTEIVMLASRLGLTHACLPVTLVNDQASTVSLWRHSLPMAFDVAHARWRLGRRPITTTHDADWGRLAAPRRQVA